MVFCNADVLDYSLENEEVTILILIDGFLQYKVYKVFKGLQQGHNPYFNRWFSAIEPITLKDAYDDCHNPYFNRWFSAITI